MRWQFVFGWLLPLALAALALWPVAPRRASATDLELVGGPSLRLKLVHPPGAAAERPDPPALADLFAFAVEGRVRNPSHRPQSGYVTVTFLDEAGVSVAEYSGPVPTVPARGEGTYTAHGSKTPRHWARIEAKIVTDPEFIFGG